MALNLTKKNDTSLLSVYNDAVKATDDNIENTAETTKKSSVTYTAPTSSAYGDLESTKYLYETGLQNIFNDYQKNIANLEQSKQQELQDAYYVRELSKKYLGEYASNAGVGDVSGNLVDIYSDYMNNEEDINANYDELKLNLDTEYQTAKEEKLEGILSTQYDIDVAKLDASAQDVWYKVLAGETDGLSDTEYLQNALNQGAIDQETYDSYLSTLQSDNYDTVYENLTNGYYGMTTDENGDETIQTDPIAYIESQKDNLSTKDYNTLMSLAKYGTAVNDLVSLDSSITSKYIKNENGETVENPDYIGDDYDFDLYTPNEDIDSTSVGYTDSAGNKYFAVKQSVDDESRKTKNTYNVTSTDLFDEWDAQYANNDVDTKFPQQEDVMTVNVSNKDNDGTTTVSYMYLNGEWHRVVQAQEFSEAQMSLWETNGKNKNVTDNFAIKNHGNKSDTITVNSATYSQNTTDYFEVGSSLTSEQQSVVDYFKQIHGEDLTDMSFVLYNGKFYEYKDGAIYSMTKKS